VADVEAEIARRRLEAVVREGHDHEAGLEHELVAEELHLAPHVLHDGGREALRDRRGVAGAGLDRLAEVRRVEEDEHREVAEELRRGEEARAAEIEIERVVAGVGERLLVVDPGLPLEAEAEIRVRREEDLSGSWALGRKARRYRRRGRGRPRRTDLSRL